MTFISLDEWLISACQNYIILFWLYWVIQSTLYVSNLFSASLQFWKKAPFQEAVILARFIFNLAKTSLYSLGKLGSLLCVSPISNAVLVS